WVLSSAYRVSRAEIGDVLGQLLGATHLVFRDVDVLLRAREAFARGRGDFADYVIREGAFAAGCDQVATFDRSLLREQGFVAP
ncbi:MAG: twitching motility protein PilT, partial [Deltaproteobacteria bacterium]